ncbi:hypothetical protein Nepgr_027402 [Nepenthes gracilis]|uniref:Uncharacterized protein n=1 Tax=Nepenthes gracilis TaxID=150966 RepID=A0AAD3Y326_NEPGR|nr:hypothetical protein Nepgr_027402 [Nepenthes gracilis]
MLTYWITIFILPRNRLKECKEQQARNILCFSYLWSCRNMKLLMVDASDYEVCSVQCVVALYEDLMLCVDACRQAEGSDGMLLAGDVDPTGRNAPENSHVEFEAKSARDGSLYDVQAFASHRYLNTSDPEIVPLRKVCRRPETDYRFHQLHILNESAPSSDLPKASSDPISGSSLVTSDSKDAAVMHPNATENPDVGTIMAAAAESNMSVGPGMVASEQKKFECSPPGLAGAVGGVPVGGTATASFQ